MYYKVHFRNTLLLPLVLLSMMIVQYSATAQRVESEDSTSVTVTPTETSQNTQGKNPDIPDRSKDQDPIPEEIPEDIGCESLIIEQFLDPVEEGLPPITIVTPKPEKSGMIIINELTDEKTVCLLVPCGNPGEIPTCETLVYKLVIDESNSSAGGGVKQFDYALSPTETICQGDEYVTFAPALHEDGSQVTDETGQAWAIACFVTQLPFDAVEHSAEQYAVNLLSTTQSTRFGQAVVRFQFEFQPLPMP